MKISVYDTTAQAYKDVEVSEFAIQVKSLGLTKEEATKKAIASAESHVKSMGEYGISEKEAVEIITKEVEKSYEE